jgi:hypothetical protein
LRRKISVFDDEKGEKEKKREKYNRNVKKNGKKFAYLKILL